MSTPRIEYILQNIETTIDGVTTANDYNQDVTGVRPTKAAAKSSRANLSALIVLTDLTPAESSPDGKQDWNAAVPITIRRIVDDTSTSALDLLLMTVASDVIKALCVDRTRGGYALDTTIESASPNRDADGAWDSVILNVNVWFRTDLDDPFSA